MLPATCSLASTEYFALELDTIAYARSDIRRDLARRSSSRLCARIALVAAVALLAAATWGVAGALGEQAASTCQPVPAIAQPRFAGDRSRPQRQSLHLGGNCRHERLGAIMSGNETVEATPTRREPTDALAKGS